jgi:hypothetical protein
MVQPTTIVMKGGVIRCMCDVNLSLKKTISACKTQISGHRWLMPVILATQEAEIRKIVV